MIKLWIRIFVLMMSVVPIMWGSGTRSEVMRRIAAPIMVGMVPPTALTLIVIPAIYALVKQISLDSKGAAHA